ncbi:hypothetical protein CM19_02050 [Candidatus Acidianus copahuensis]|uniref:Uncharacterized protein n=1 Tax=Candidatus Acidianus copahuensis TaxID=1160895 RepID=A0A031LU57_9CREN|nr:ACT domain-containing protein [Candidatus Acidianus copahuensis]EZQ11014.1 hypothetical protein CM19_02050 [Candidatus Acidianus copahuensis]
MTREKVVKITGYYRDPGFLERIMGNFRKLWVDIDWVNARRITDDGLYEVYLGIKDTKNTYLAIINASKMVDVEKIEVLEDAEVTSISVDNKGRITDSGSMVIFVPVYNKITTYSWGDKYSQDIH